MFRVYVFTLPNLYDKVKAKMELYNVDYKISLQKGYLDIIIDTYKPHVFLSVGGKWSEHVDMANSEFKIREKWLHYETIQDINPTEIKNVYLNWTTRNVQKVSIVTITDNNFNTINILYNSLLAQTEKNWEWVILDKSNGDKFCKLLERMKKKDQRIKYFSFYGDKEMEGVLLKNACMLTSGEIIIQLKANCKILPQAIQMVTDAFDKNLQVGFVSAYSVNLKEQKEGWGLGHGYNYYQFLNRVVECVSVCPRMTSKTIQSIVSFPHNFICWRKSFYISVGGHNERLINSQDYELICRMFLNYRIAYIPELLCIEASPPTPINNKNIDILISDSVQAISNFYSKRYRKDITSRIKQLGYKFDNDRVTFDWETDRELVNQCFNIYTGIDAYCVSIVIPTYNRPQNLICALESIKLQTYKNWIVWVIGDNCPVMDKTLCEYVKKDTFEWGNHLRWWNLERHYGEGGAVPRNYALKGLVKTDMIAFLDDDDIWKNNHLETMVSTMKSAGCEYVFSSFSINDVEIICKKPLYGRLITSCILIRRGLLDRYGYWKVRTSEFYWHDFEFFNRWKEENYGSTGLVTVVYGTDFTNVDPIGVKNLYDDQKEEEECNTTVDFTINTTLNTIFDISEEDEEDGDEHCGGGGGNRITIGEHCDSYDESSDEESGDEPFPMLFLIDDKTGVEYKV